MARSAPIPPELGALFARPRQLAFLVGSGISAASGLPTGWAFNAGLASYLSIDADARRSARALFITGPASNPEGSIRFEHALQVLRDSVDPDLQVLTCFEAGRTPTYLHHFLARMLLRGSQVLTTNFDALIEAAYLSTPAGVRRGLRQVAYERDPRRRPRAVASFASCVARGARHRSPALYKLHGTLRDLSFVLHGDTTRRYVDSLGVTLDAIVTRRGPWRLEPAKMEAVRAAVASRTVVLLGYSGLDDFDVVPALSLCLPTARALVYFQHTSSRPAVWTRVTDAASSAGLPASLRPVVGTGLAVWTVTGPTSAAVEEVWATGFGTTTYPAAPVRATLRRTAPYRDLSDASRLGVLAAMLEGASRLDEAARTYRACVRALGTGGRGTALWAKCKNNLGNLERQRAHYGTAKPLLRDAIAGYRRLGMTLQVGSAQNNLGLCYLYEGKLAPARRYLASARDAFLRATEPRRAARATTNLAIVARRRGSFDEALALSRAALRLSERARDAHGQAQDWGNIGVAYWGLGRYRDAAEAYGRSIRLARKLAAKGTLAAQLGNLAIVKRELGDLAGSLPLITEALSLNREAGRQDAVADNLTNLGEHHERAGAPADAERCYVEALGIATRVKHASGMSEALADLARLRVAQGRRSEAAALLRRAARAFRRIGNSERARQSEAEARRVLARARP